jgi:hypothetical protein
VQVAPTQLALALENEHRVPHPPQLLASVCVLTSQPLGPRVSQSAKPDEHTPTAHVPERHTGVAFGRLQAVPHAPQLRGLVARSTQPPGHVVMEQTVEHIPPEHAIEPEHVRPQTPQLVTVFSGASQPLLVSPSQFAKPELHAMVHEPPEHTAVPLVELQTRPQVPQLLVVVVETSQPLVMLSSQSEKPALHVSTQVPVVHTPVALAPAQARPHAPQLVSVLVGVSQPLLARMSQSAKPGLQVIEHVATPAEFIVHEGTPFVESHSIPHAPQCWGDVPVLTQPPAQSVCPMGHAMSSGITSVAIMSAPASVTSTPPSVEPVSEATISGGGGNSLVGTTSP